MTGMFAGKKKFIFDIDGTIALGPVLIDGAKEFIERLERDGREIFILTNNTSKTPRMCSEQLRSYGLDADKIRIITPLDACVRYFVSKGYERVYWAAVPEVSEYLTQRGLRFDRERPQAILLAFDKTVTYEKFQTITRLIHEGTPYYATHIDIVCPTELGYPIPDVGSFIELLRLTTGQTPLATFGKPNPSILTETVASDGSFDDIVIFGDRLYTDIKLAENCGALSVLVFSGETTREMYEASDIKAGVTVDTIADLLAETL
ncbi:MAG: HAD-IIA family hydrolase [Oscillospiraceae bacterium]|jgi:HAD superfamily hydrolase (TIGR01450 family)|nr:HAD-IIA family hydrolase [Oscillospiraceae bacterium]